MEKMTLKDISAIEKTPIVSFKELIAVGDADICSDIAISVGGKGGAKTKLFKSNYSAVTVSIKCKTDKALTLKIGYIKGNGDISFDGITEIRANPDSNGYIHFWKIFDAANLIVYFEAVEFFVQIDCEEKNCFSIVEGMVWERKHFEESDIYGANLEQIIYKIENKLSKTSYENANNTETIAVSPSGIKFILNVDDEGRVYTTPTVPNNVLFVGNSLLLGMGNYGMCSTSPRADFYYHVCEEIKKKNPNAEFNRVHGAMYEQLDDQEKFDSLWNEMANPFTGKPMKESFTEDIDLIIIQLGENVSTRERARSLIATIDKFISLIKHNCPKARIIWVHGWFNEWLSGSIIVDACRRWRIGQLCIKDLNTKENQGKLGQKCELANGEAAAADDLWLTHPGDAGMKAIADRIIDFLKM